MRTGMAMKLLSESYGLEKYMQIPELSDPGSG